MRLGCNQKEILKLHALRGRRFGQFNAFAFAEEKGNCVSQLHTSQMDADARSSAGAEGVKCRFCVGG